MTGDPHRSGGSHSTTADLSDMRSTATVLDKVADDVRGAAGSIVSALLRLPMTAVPFSPGRAAQLGTDQLRLTSGPHGLLATSFQLEAAARGLRFSAGAYQAADTTAKGLFSALAIATAPARVAIAVTGSLALATASSVPLNPQTDFLRDALMPSYARNRGWVDTFKGSVALAIAMDPSVTDAALFTVQGVVFAGTPQHPLTLSQQAEMVVLTGRGICLLRDDIPLTVTPVSPHDHRQQPPKEAGDVLDSINSIESSVASADNTSSRVRVRHVTGADGQGAWIVEVPGTQDWSAKSPTNPADLTANLAAVAGLPSTLYPAIEQALRTSMAKAGVKPGTEPVMLAGHSQGGIVATRMAQDQRFRSTFRVTQVMTAGSPVSNMALPDSVKSLDLAHRRDVVPRLDTQGSPDALNRYGITGDPTPRAGDLQDAIAIHGADRYAESARDWAPANSTDPDVADFYDSPFFNGDSGTVDDYHLHRKPPDVVARVERPDSLRDK